MSSRTAQLLTFITKKNKHLGELFFFFARRWLFYFQVLSSRSGFWIFSLVVGATCPFYRYVYLYSVGKSWKTHTQRRRTGIGQQKTKLFFLVGWWKKRVTECRKVETLRAPPRLHSRNEGVSALWHLPPMVFSGFLSPCGTHCVFFLLLVWSTVFFFFSLKEKGIKQTRKFEPRLKNVCLIYEHLNGHPKKGFFLSPIFFFG